MRLINHLIEFNTCFGRKQFFFVKSVKNQKCQVQKHLIIHWHFTLILISVSVILQYSTIHITHCTKQKKVHISSAYQLLTQNNENTIVSHMNRVNKTMNWPWNSRMTKIIHSTRFFFFSRLLCCLKEAMAIQSVCYYRSILKSKESRTNWWVMSNTRMWKNKERLRRDRKKMSSIEPIGHQLFLTVDDE